MTLHLTPEEAARLGLIERKPPRGTRKTAKGPYHSQCCHAGCDQEFRTVAAEDRHLAATGHTRYSVLFEEDLRDHG